MENSVKDESESIKKQISRSAFLVMLGSIVSLAFGFVSQLVVASIFGANAGMDAYLTAMVVPGYVSSVLLAGMTFVLIPAFVQIETEGSKEDAWALVGTSFWITTVVFSLVAMIGSVFSPSIIHIIAPGYNQEKAALASKMLSVQMFTLPFISLGAVTAGIQNARGRFFAPALAVGIGSIVNIISVVILSPTLGPFALSWGNFCAMVVNGCITIIPVLKHGWNSLLPIFDQRIKKLAILVVPFIFFGLLTGSSSVFERFFASGLPDGDLSYIGYARKISGVFVAVFATSIATVLFPVMAREHSKKGIIGLSNQAEYGLQLTLAVALPSVAIIGVVALPLVTVFLQRGAFNKTDSYHVSQIIFIVMLGDILFRMISNVIIRTFYVLKDTITVPVVNTITTILYVVCARFFSHTWGYIGLALAQAFQSGLSILIVLYPFSKKMTQFNYKRIMKEFMCYLLFSSIGACFTWIMMRLLSGFPAIIQLLISSSTGIIIYLIMLFLYDKEITWSVFEIVGVTQILTKIQRVSRKTTKWT